MKLSLILMSFLFGSSFAHADDLSEAKSISEKLYIQMSSVIPNQLGENDELQSDCALRDLYITCRVTDVNEELGYTHGISVKFDHYSGSLTVNGIQCLQH